MPASEIGWRQSSMARPPVGSSRRVPARACSAPHHGPGPCRCCARQYRWLRARGRLAELEVNAPGLGPYLHHEHVDRRQSSFDPLPRGERAGVVANVLVPKLALFDGRERTSDGSHSLRLVGVGAGSRATTGLRATCDSRDPASARSGFSAASATSESEPRLSCADRPPEARLLAVRGLGPLTSVRPASDDALFLTCSHVVQLTTPARGGPGIAISYLASSKGSPGKLF